MPRIHLCFLWHMHQPFYKDLATGEYRLPWTRFHALKDYYGMVKILGEFPEIRQTFNLVPSMVAQIEEYAAGEASDPFLRCALKPAEQLTDSEAQFVLRYFFQANVDRLIYRYPRYAQLYELWRGADQKPERARRIFQTKDLRDLQVLSQLAWFDEEFLTHDEEVRELVAKERDYSIEDQALIGRKEREICAKVMPVYEEFANTGQIEVSTTPFYHPILPLLCDSDIARVAHPGVPLPTRFRYPDDARIQLERAREFMQGRTGTAPIGLWPSEGSVSDEALGLAAECGFTWAATDNGVLARTLNLPPSPETGYRPYLWRHATDHSTREMHMLFRDHELSDLIGFTYQRVPPKEAARHFLQKIRDNCSGILRSGREALVPVILDGENCWEYYAESGRDFLRELYRGILEDGRMEAVTVSEGLQRVEPAVIGHIFPASWISANFDVWIGAEEDNRAWEYLLRAREAYERATSVPSERRAFAFEELLIAEGSDWCWWYGPEHHSDNREEFDQLFRDHLKNVYRALSLAPPAELDQPILKVTRAVLHRPPLALIHPVLDGEVTSYFEWMGAGLYEVDSRQGAMHGGIQPVERLHYGTDGQWAYVRLDVRREAFADPKLWRIEIRGSHAKETYALAEVSFGSVIELRAELEKFGQLQISLERDGVPVQTLPESGWLEIQPSSSEWTA